MSVKITKRGDRGFHQYGKDAACTYGTTMRVYESGSAEGPHVWLNLKAGPALTPEGQEPVDVSAHLNRKQALRLIERLQTWVDEIPRRWRK
jgi:hypothetical protein